MIDKIYMIYDLGLKSYVRKSKHGGFRYYTELKPCENYVKDLQWWKDHGIEKDFMIGSWRIDEFSLTKIGEIECPE